MSGSLTVPTSLSQQRRRGDRPRLSPAQILLILPLLALFVGFFVIPLLVMFVISLLSGNPVSDRSVHFTLANYEKLFSDALYIDVLVDTITLGVLTTVFTVLIGYPLAFQLARTRSPRIRTLLLVAILSPMLTGIVVRTYAWMALLSDNGIINSGLISLGLTDAPAPLMYNTFGVVVALVHIYVPFMVLTVTGVIGKIDISLEEAARSLGATTFRTFVEVTLPLSMPGILAGSLLVFSLAISSYVTPILMGGFSILTLPILIYQQLSGVFNFAFAAALSFLLLLVSLVIVIAYFRIVRRFAEGAFS
jgi:putative spermidine/putrescine transport system permease protein